MPAQRSDPEQQVVTLADGRRIASRTWAGDGLPLVLLHGLLDSAVGWDRLCASSARHCVALDLPGFGSSDLPAQPRLAAYADDVAAALDRLGVGRAVVVGHSIGGGIAAALADRDPARVAGLVLLAPAGFGRIPLAEAVSVPGLRNLAARCLPLALANPVVLAAAYASFVTNGHLPEAELLQRVIRRAFEATPGAVAGTKAVVAAGQDGDGLHRRRSRFRGAVDVLWGTRDRVVPHRHVDGVQRALPQARIEVWEGMGHHPQRERGQELGEFVATAAELADRSPAAREPAVGSRRCPATARRARRPRPAMAAAPSG